MSTPSTPSTPSTSPLLFPNGIPITNNVFNMAQFGEMSHHALVGWLIDTAKKQDELDHFRNLPDWVAGPPRFRQHAEALSQKEDAAKYKDILAGRERDLERLATMDSINNNACYTILIARHFNDETILHKSGHEVKEKPKRTHTTVSVSTRPLKLIAKPGDELGSIVLIVERDPGAGLYRIEFCKGAPTGEESWKPFGDFKKVRIFINGLDRAGWYYFRVRSVGDNAASPWSAAVDIIVG